MKYSSFNILMICITLISFQSNGQSYKLVKEIGNFNKASSFCLSPEGYFYVSDLGAGQVLKLNMDGAVFATAGGYGWDARSLTAPTDICAEVVYILVSDENNNKINKYDKSLNLAGTVYKKGSLFSDEVFGYPLSVTVSTLGDLYVLDGENNRIVYFSFFGDYKGNFGGFNSGFYTLNKPTKITSLKNSIAVLDYKDVVFFDHFGSYINKLSFDQRFISIKGNDGKITLTSKREIFVSDDSYNPDFIKLTIDYQGVWFVDSFIAGEKLYILTENSILFFEINN